MLTQQVSALQDELKKAAELCKQDADKATQDVNHHRQVAKVRSRGTP